MSVFYDLASLVLVPSGYKASKVYAQKPLTTDGQLAFSRASTATRVNSAGLIEAVSSNVPRLDYLGSTCPKLLLEPQRTNLLTYSEAFNVGGAWDKNDVTVTADTTVSPDGVQNADTINATVEGQRINQTVTVSASTQYTFSFYAKKGTMATPRYSVYDLSNGAFILTQVNYSSLVNTSTWSRITATFTTPSGCTSIAVYPINGASTGTIFLWGAMLEQGAYPTSYVKTEGTAVTRLADSAYKDGIGSLFGTNVGSFFVEAEGPFYPGVAAYLFDISDNSSDIVNRFALYATSTSNLQLFTNTGTSFTASATARKKIALIWNGTNTKVYLNGSKVVDITYANANPTSINLNSRFNDVEHGNSKFSQVMAFKTALTDAQAKELTAL